MQTKNSKCFCGSGKKFKRCCLNSKNMAEVNYPIDSMSRLAKKNNELKIQNGVFRKIIRILYERVPETREIIDNLE